ncbi:hypothetical protein RCH05_000819 [Janthinobacterium sp. CAN_S7]
MVRWSYLFCMYGIAHITVHECIYVMIRHENYLYPRDAITETTMTVSIRQACRQTAKEGLC